MADHQENQNQKEKENLVINFNSSSSDGYSSDDSLYSSSDMFGYHSDSDEEPIDSSELESMKAASKTDAPVAREFLRSLMQEQKGKGKMLELSPKKKIPDPEDLAAMRRTNRGIIIRETAENAVPHQLEETANQDESAAVESLRAHQFRLRSKKIGTADGHGDNGKRVWCSLSKSPPTHQKKAKLTSLDEYEEKMKPEEMYYSGPAPDETSTPNRAAVDGSGLKSDLGFEIEELMNKGPEFRDEMYAKILVHLLQCMPVCATRGGVPEGTITRGFLFKVDPVEGPKIICTCHGQFFDAGGFVEHAGGEPNVSNPARFIHLEFF